MTSYELMSVISSAAAGLAALATGFVSWRIYQLQNNVFHVAEEFSVERTGVKDTYIILLIEKESSLWMN